MDVTIRPMTVDDTPEVGVVHVRAWQAAYRGVMPDDYLDALRAEDRADMWRRGIEQGLPGQRDVVVCEGMVVGFAAYGLERGAVDEPGVGELFAINLDPDHWRRGLGRRLFRHVMAEFTRLGYRRAVLWVAAENDRARQFYDVEGFSFDGAERVDTVQGAVVNECRYAADLPRPNGPDHR